MQNSGSILPRVVSRNQPRGIQRIVCQRLEHWFSATNSSGATFVFFFTRKVYVEFIVDIKRREQKLFRKAVTEKKRTFLLH